MSNDYIRDSHKRKRKHGGNKPGNPAMMSGALPSPAIEEEEECADPMDDGVVRKKVKKEHKRRKVVEQISEVATKGGEVKPVVNGVGKKAGAKTDGHGEVPEDDEKVAKRARKEKKAKLRAEKDAQVAQEVEAGAEEEVNGQLKEVAVENGVADVDGEEEFADFGGGDEEEQVNGKEGAREEPADQTNGHDAEGR